MWLFRALSAAAVAWVLTQTATFADDPDALRRLASIGDIWRDADDKNVPLPDHKVASHAERLRHRMALLPLVATVCSVYGIEPAEENGSKNHLALLPILGGLIGLVKSVKAGLKRCCDASYRLGVKVPIDELALLNQQSQDSLDSDSRIYLPQRFDSDEINAAARVVDLWLARLALRAEDVADDINVPPRADVGETAPDPRRLETGIASLAPAYLQTSASTSDRKVAHLIGIILNDAKSGRGKRSLKEYAKLIGYSRTWMNTPAAALVRQSLAAAFGVQWSIRGEKSSSGKVEAWSDDE